METDPHLNTPFRARSQWSQRRPSQLNLTVGLGKGNHDPLPQIHMKEPPLRDPDSSDGPLGHPTTHQREMRPRTNGGDNAPGPFQGGEEVSEDHPHSASSRSISCRSEVQGTSWTFHI